MNFDIIIKNGKIIDGAGNPWYRAEIGISDGKIVEIKPKIDGGANKIIDATNLIACPGFIDIHSHTDYVLPIATKVQSTIHQGITTSVVGMCGDGLAPIPAEKKDEFKKRMSSMIPIFDQLEIPWSTFVEYLGEVDKYRNPSNFAFAVGYNNIRFAGGQGFENRSATPEELESMKSYLVEAMEAGAFGMSTGLIYAPQIFSSTEELIELAKIVARYGGLYFSHIRGEDETVVKAVKEVIEIVEKSGCAGGQIAHHKISGKPNWGKSVESLRAIEEANVRGVNVSCDQYPYNRGMSGLVTALPPWAREGGNEKILERLKDSQIRERIIKDVETGIEGWEDWIKIDGFENLYISAVNTDKWKGFIGKNITEITKLKGYPNNWQTFFEILIDEKLGVFITIESMEEEDIRRIMTSRYQMVGTDGFGIPTYLGAWKFHPRCFGTYPRILGRYVREESLLTLENAIRKMTSYPAQRLGLRDRGLIKEGNWADIVLFDPETVIDKATYDDPHQFPEGMPYVIVNGVLVIDKGKQLRKYPGKVLRRLHKN